MATVNAADIHAFANRDWALVERAKTEQWIRQKATMTPAEILRLQSELIERARLLRPDWPSAEDRQADFEAHVRLSEILQRASQNWSR
jgi:hypothetical protein